MKEAILLCPDESQRLLGEWNNTVSFQSIHCPIESGHQRPGRRIGQLSIELPERAMLKPFAWTLYSECLISGDALETLHSASLTGFDTHPVEITRKGTPIDHSYRELIITGWAGVAREDSGVKLQKSCVACGLLEYSGVTEWNKLLDWNLWDRSDFYFVWPLPRFIFLTQKAASVIKQLSDYVRLIPICEMEPQDGLLSPGRLSHWIPEDRLREIGADPAIL